MADAINTGNPVDKTTFIVNKYDDIDGSRANQDTPRGRLCFRDTNGRMTLPRNLTEAKLAVYPVDWAKPLNPGPYFDGPGLNGATFGAVNDGSLDNQQGSYLLDQDLGYVTGWPAAIKVYDIPPMFYNLPVTSGNKVLVWDAGTFTYGSGAYSGVSSDYSFGSKVYAEYTAGNEGKITASGSVAGNTAIGTVVGREIFGTNTITVKLKGTAAL